MISDPPGSNYFDPQVTIVLIFQVQYSQIPQVMIFSYVPLNKDFDPPGYNVFRCQVTMLPNATRNNGLDTPGYNVLGFPQVTMFRCPR